jgi:hypothetical protein
LLHRRRRLDERRFVEADRVDAHANSPEVIFSHYRELVKPDAAKAWFDVKAA